VGSAGCSTPLSPFKPRPAGFFISAPARPNPPFRLDSLPSTAHDLPMIILRQPDGSLLVMLPSGAALRILPDGSVVPAEVDQAG
jgi:hypothetical protein